jgi:hypothetical protein
MMNRFHVSFNFAFEFNLRRYMMEAALGSGLATAGDYLAVGTAQCNTSSPHIQLSSLELLVGSRLELYIILVV